MTLTLGLGSAHARDATACARAPALRGADRGCMHTIRATRPCVCRMPFTIFWILHYTTLNSPQSAGAQPGRRRRLNSLGHRALLEAPVGIFGEPRTVATECERVGLPWPAAESSGLIVRKGLHDLRRGHDATRERCAISGAAAMGRDWLRHGARAHPAACCRQKVRAGPLARQCRAPAARGPRQARPHPP